MLKKILIVVFIILILIGCIRSCVSGDDESDTTTTTSTTTEIISEDTTENTVDNIESLEFSNSVIYELKVGDSDYTSLRVVYDDDFSIEDIIFVSSDESVATVEVERKSRSLVYFDIKAVGAGSAKIHAETKNGLVKSEEITVVVEGSTTKAVETTEEKTTMGKITEKETTSKKVSNTEKTTSKKDVSSVEYILNTNSKKIHKSTCSSVDEISPKNFDKTTDYDKAISQGYVPCKNCNP